MGFQARRTVDEAKAEGKELKVMFRCSGIVRETGLRWPSTGIDVLVMVDDGYWTWMPVLC